MPAVGKNKNDKFICFAYGIKMDELDEFRCFLANFSATLSSIHFGYICFGFLTLIILISIFGRIKENYKWFILNQAFWDLLISYQFICHNEGDSLFLKNFQPSCFFDFPNDESSFLHEFILGILKYNSYSALLLLSSTQFLCLYFMNLYEKLTQGRRIFYLILIFNFLMILLHLETLFGYLLVERIKYLRDKCINNQEAQNISIEFCDDLDLEEKSDDFLWNFYHSLNNIFNVIVTIKPIICLLISLIAAIMLIYKIGKRAKFQIKHNRRDFMNSFRITLVILFQTLINFLVLFLQFINSFEIIFLSTFDVFIKTTWARNKYCENCIDFRLPLWIDGHFGLAYPVNLQTIVQFRIFIISIIVLLVMAGYREALVNFIHFIHHAIKHPRLIFSTKSFRPSTITQSAVSSFN